MVRLRTLGLAVTGVVLGHTLAYIAATPSALTRDALLRATGHAYWDAAVLAAVAGALWYAADHAARLFTAGRHSVATPLSPRDLTLHLRVLQVTLFVALEVGERAAVGVPVSSILSHRVFLLGVAFQLLIAPVLSLLVRVLGAAARAAGRATAGERFLRAPAVRVIRIAHWAPFVSGVPATPCGIRGPPLSR